MQEEAGETKVGLAPLVAQRPAGQLVDVWHCEFHGEDSWEGAHWVFSEFSSVITMVFEKALVVWGETGTLTARLLSSLSLQNEVKPFMDSHVLLKFIKSNSPPSPVGSGEAGPDSIIFGGGN